MLFLLWSKVTRNRLSHLQHSALIALRRGYASATLASVDATKFPANYHWPSDTPENLDWQTMRRAFAVADRFIRRGESR